MALIDELHAQRAAAVDKARKINDRAKSGETLTAEDRSQLDGFLDEADKLKTRIDGLVADERRSSRLKAAEESLSETRGRRTREDGPGDDDENDGGEGRERQRGDQVRSANFGRTISASELRYRVGELGGLRSGTERVIELRGRRATPEYRKAFDDYMRYGRRSGTLAAAKPRAVDVDIDESDDAEQRSLQAGIDVEGGYLVAPMQMASGIIKALDDNLLIRQLASVERVVGTGSLGYVSLDTDPDDAEWTSEIATVSEDQAMRFGRRELNPRPLAKLVKISNTLLRRAASIQALLEERVAYKFGVTQEKAFLTGNGAEKPLGLFTASNMGIPTSRDVSTGNTTTAMTYDGLVNAFQSVKQAYQARGTWIFHRAGVTNLMLIKDGEGRPMWQQGTLAGKPDTLFGRPIVVSEYAPSTFTTGLYVGLFGDLSFYKIAETMSLEMVRLNELFQLSNQTGVVARQDVDAMPALAEAFVRVKLG